MNKHINANAGDVACVLLQASSAQPGLVEQGRNGNVEPERYEISQTTDENHY